MLPVKIKKEPTEFDYDLSNVTMLSGRYITDDCSSFPSVWVNALESDSDRPIEVDILKDSRVCYWYAYLLEKRSDYVNFAI